KNRVTLCLGPKLAPFKTPSPQQRTGAPHLARFSRDVGYHCSFPSTLDSSDTLSGQHRWYPTSREKPARYGAPVLCEGREPGIYSLAGLVLNALSVDISCD